MSEAHVGSPDSERSVQGPQQQRPQTMGPEPSAASGSRSGRVTAPPTLPHHGMVSRGAQRDVRPDDGGAVPAENIPSVMGAASTESVPTSVDGRVSRVSGRSSSPVSRVSRAPSRVAGVHLGKRRCAQPSRDVIDVARRHPGRACCSSNVRTRARHVAALTKRWWAQDRSGPKVGVGVRVGVSSQVRSVKEDQMASLQGQVTG